MLSDYLVLSNMICVYNKNRELKYVTHRGKHVKLIF